MSEQYRVEVFFDGDCPLCLREIQMLRWFDKGKGRILFTDIADEGFRPEDYGKTMEELMAEIHGRLPGGRWIIGMEVFRELYAAIGFGFLFWPTKLPGIRNVADWGYQVFARNRLKWTGRCTDECRIPKSAAQETT